MSQISFPDLNDGIVPVANDFNSRYNSLKNRINLGVETDNIADASVTAAKLAPGILATGSYSRSFLLAGC